MKLSSTALAALLFTSSTTSSATTSSSVNAENEQRFETTNIDRKLLGAPRIISGVDAPEGRYPYTVSLDTGSFHFCGGSLIAPNVVLSAAHCFEPLDKAATRAIVNPYKLSDANSDETFEIDSFVKHPAYQSLGGYDHDYMVIKLKGISSNPYVRLNEDTSVPTIDTTLEVMGWGSTALSGYTESDTLQQVDVLAMSNADCETKYSAAGLAGQIFDDSLCVAEVNQGSCQGDSGGPLVLADNGDYKYDIQVGVVSWGIGCAMEEHPGVYSRVSDEFDWIKEQVCAMSPNDAPAYFGCAPVDPPGTVGGSCANSCGGQSLTSGASCYCDDVCIELEDCCFDALEYCPIERPAPPTSAPTTLANTCAGQCGEASLDGSCFCDFVCIEYGDCCEDVAPFCQAELGTCNGACGEQTLTADATCYCDEYCVEYGDCCFDASSTCPSHVVKAIAGRSALGRQAGGRSAARSFGRGTHA